MSNSGVTHDSTTCLSLKIFILQEFLDQIGDFNVIQIGEGEKAISFNADFWQMGNLVDYDRIFVGYPSWWYKMPMVMYGFFEQHDLIGKMLTPFTTHGGSRFSDSLREIKRLLPNAQLVTQCLAIYKK